MRVHLIDGPLAGHTVGYLSPLPQILVVADKSSADGIRWHDYKQTDRTDRYRHWHRCKCLDNWQRRPVDLDAVNE